MDPSLALSVEPSRGTPVSERLNRMLGALRSRRPLYAQCWVVRQGSPSEVRGMGGIRRGSCAVLGGAQCWVVHQGWPSEVRGRGGIRRGSCAVPHVPSGEVGLAAFRWGQAAVLSLRYLQGMGGGAQCRS